MTTVEEGKEILRALIEEDWSSIAGMDDMAKRVAPNYVHHAFAMDIDFAGFRRGFTGLATGFPGSHYKIRHLFGDGEMFGALVSITGTQSGQLGPIAPTGKEVTTQGAYHCRIVDGKIVEDWEVWACIPIPRQMGIVLQG